MERQKRERSQIDFVVSDIEIEIEDVTTLTTPTSLTPTVRTLKKTKIKLAARPKKPVFDRKLISYGFRENEKVLSSNHEEVNANYQMALKNYYAQLQAWAKEAVKDDQNIPYGKRSTASLERECAARSLDTSGTRDVLTQRLLRHDTNKKDKSVTTSEMMLLEKTSNVTVFIDPQANNYVYANAKAISNSLKEGGIGILLVLPHDVIRMILKHFDECFDYKSLRSLMMTCKFIHADVTKFLIQRSQALFGPGGNLRALSALNRIQNMHVDMRGIMPFSTLMGTMAHRFEVPHCNLGATDLINSYTVGVKVLRACISKYGSIEGLGEHNRKAKQVLVNKRLDESIVVSGRRDRFDNLMKALSALGYPELFVFVQTIPEYRGKCLLDAKNHPINFWEKDWAKRFAKCCAHVKKAQPATLEAVLKGWPKFEG